MSSNSKTIQIRRSKHSVGATDVGSDAAVTRLKCYSGLLSRHRKLSYLNGLASNSSSKTTKQLILTVVTVIALVFPLQSSYQALKAQSAPGAKVFVPLALQLEGTGSSQSEGEEVIDEDTELSQSEGEDTELSQSEEEEPSDDLSVTAAAVPTCSSLERLWGTWCVYTWDNDLPDRMTRFPPFYNVYHASAWRKAGKWYMVFGGWRDPAVQTYQTQYLGLGTHDRIFRISTTDSYGIYPWTLDQNGAFEYISNNWETSSSTDCPPNYQLYPPYNTGNCYTSSNTAHAFHNVQPDMFAMQWTRPRPAGWDCCDTIFYSYDFDDEANRLNILPEANVGVHYAWISGADGSLQRAGQYGHKNPLLDWHTGATPSIPITAVSDARVVYDPATAKFYMVYVDWTVISGQAKGFISLAQSNWTNLRFSLVSRNIIQGSGNGEVNPQIVIVGSGPYQYYLFYTKYLSSTQAEIRVIKSSGGVTGPYSLSNSKLVLKPPANSPYKIVGTPYVFCNNALNPPRWQMYFSAAAQGSGGVSDEVYGSNFPYNNQILVAFLKKNCEYNPNNPTAPPTTPPVWD